MRRKAQEITEKEILEKILQDGEVLHLAMVDGNRPYILPLNYGYRDNHLYIHCAREGHKIDILRMNNHVAFEILEKAELVKGVNACDWSTKYRSVVGEGSVEIVDEPGDKTKALEIIMNQFGAPELNVFEPRYVDAIYILKIEITELVGKQSKVFEL